MSSEDGLAYARIHQLWGTDPAAFLEREDDVLAHNLRAALASRLVREPKPEDEAEKHLAGMERAHRYGEELRKVYG